MVRNAWGQIIVVSSPVVSNPPANKAPYTMSKSAQEALMLTLAEELKYTGVTTNVLRVRTIDIQHERDTSPSPENIFGLHQKRLDRLPNTFVPMRAVQ